MMKYMWIILPKIAFWLIIIGVALLLVPNPRWSPAIAYTLIGSGVGFMLAGIVAIARRRNQRPANAPPRTDD
ncbi:MAG: hypothetical protein KDG50_05605 [Chromatiales bacterium]|nr:hypothetical protein [Chromatiales bacterium]